eukprot:184325_1
MKQRVDKWKELPTPYNQMNIWGVEEDYWESVKNTILSKILTVGIKYEFSVEDMFHLDGLNWLTDRDVNSFGDYLNDSQEVVEILCVPTWAAEKWYDLLSLPSTKSVQYSYVLSEHNEKAKLVVNSWIKKTVKNLNDANKTIKIHTLLFPINEKGANKRGVHWVLGKICLTDLNITVQNSWGGSSVQNMNHGAKIFYTSMGYLIPQYLSRNGFQYKNKFDFSNGKAMKKWNFKNDIIQHNGSDCGVYVCVEMEANVKKKIDLIKLENREIYQHARLCILGKLVL